MVEVKLYKDEMKAALIAMAKGGMQFEGVNDNGNIKGLLVVKNNDDALACAYEKIAKAAGYECEVRRTQTLSFRKEPCTEYERQLPPTSTDKITIEGQALVNDMCKKCPEIMDKKGRER